jgi:tRNA threonylcarbamoyladenosine modification (KEOPS) complex Cgi121 subunit
MEEGLKMIVSSYQGYSFAAAVVENILRDPLELFEDYDLPEDCAVQFVDPRCIYTHRQLLVGFMSAVDAYLVNAQRARKIEVEFLLRLSGKRQISEAIEVVGHKQGERCVCVCAITRSGGRPDEAVSKIAEYLGGSLSDNLEAGRLEHVLSLYGVSQQELECLAPSRGARPAELLILERIAMSGLL